MDLLLRLADEVGELGRRLEQVSTELRTYQREELTRPIEQPEAVKPMDPQPVMPVAPVLPQPVLGPTPPQTPPYPQLPYPGYQPYQPYPQQPVRPPPASLFERLGQDGAGSRLLAWIGGAVTLLGVVLLLVLAVQRGWLGPLPRVLSGAALGGALIGVGLWVHRSPNGRTGAFALAATGIAALYLDAVAATTLFEYLPELGGLAAGLVIAIAGLLLAARWNSVVLGTAVVVGCAVCAPMITKGFTPELVAFLLMVQVATTPVQLKKTWPSVALAAGAAPLLASVLSTARGKHVEALPNAIAALVALVVGVVLALVSARRRENDQVAIGLLVWAAAPALLSAILLPKWQAVAVAGVAAVVMLIAWVISPMKNVAAIATLVSVFQATVVAFDGTARSATLLGEAALLALLAFGLKDRATLWGALGFGVAGGYLAIITDVPPTFLTLEPSQPPVGKLAAALLSSLLILAVSVLLPWIASATGNLKAASQNLAPWLFAGVTALYGAAGIVLAVALLIAPDRNGFLLGHVVVTVSWTVAALMLLLRGIGVRALRVIGLVLVGAAVLKLVLFDLSALDGLARVAAFLGAGLILLAAGTRYARLVARRAG
jgi:uncharacterized membrane protein